MYRFSENREYNQQDIKRLALEWVDKDQEAKQWFLSWLDTDARIELCIEMTNILQDRKNKGVK